MNDRRDQDETQSARVAGGVRERLGESSGVSSPMADVVRIGSDMARRRRYTPEFRERVVRTSYESGLPVREVARQYGIGLSLLSRWRKLAREECQTSGGTSFVPVMLAPTPQPVLHEHPGSVSGCARTSLVFPDVIRLEFDMTLSGERLREIMAVLRS